MSRLEAKTVKQLLAAGLAVVVVLAIMGGAVYYQKNHNDKKTEQKQLTPKEQAVKSYGDKNYDSAITQVNDLISKDPKESTNYNLKANILRDKGDIAGASENYNKAIELNPHVLAPYTNAGHMFINQGDKKAVNAIVEKGLKEFPGQKDLLDLQKQAK